MDTSVSSADQGDIQIAQVRHWEARCAKSRLSILSYSFNIRKSTLAEYLSVTIIEKALLDKHEKEHAEEMDKLEREHPGATDRRKACQDKRAAVKKHELKLMHDRHDESFHGMNMAKLKADRYWLNNRAQILADTHEDDKMKKLKAKLQAEGKM